MGNLFGKITTDAGPLEDEINCDCSRSPTIVYIDAQHRLRSQSKVYITRPKIVTMTESVVLWHVVMQYMFAIG